MRKLALVAALAALAFVAAAQSPKVVSTSPIVMTGTGEATEAREIPTQAITMTGLGGAPGAKEINTPAITMTGSRR